MCTICIEDNSESAFMCEFPVSNTFRHTNPHIITHHHTAGSHVYYHFKGMLALHRCVVKQMQFSRVASKRKRRWAVPTGNCDI